MSPWDDLVERITRPLRVDPELRREVSRELAGHLEDSMSAFCAGGMSEVEAEAAAAKGLGAEEEIAGQLWQANRRRVRIRRTVKWAAGVTLLPASAVISVSMAWGAIVSTAVLVAGMSYLTYLSGPLVDQFNRRILADLPSDARAVLATPGSPDEMFAGAKALADAHPGDAIYYSNFAGKCLSQIAMDKAGGPIDRSKLEEALVVLDRGKQIEPDNGAYALAKAGLLFAASSRRLEGRPLQILPGLSYQVNDAPMFEKALFELHEAAGKRFIATRSAELLERSLQTMPRPSTLSEELWRRERMANVSQPFLRFYSTSPGLWQAVELAQHGHMERALEIVGDSRRIAALIALRSELENEMIFAHNIYHNALKLEMGLASQAGDDAIYARALTLFNDEQVILNRIFQKIQSTSNAAQEPTDNMSLVDLRFLGYRPPIDRAPGRRAEYALADRLALSVLLTILTVVCAAGGAGAAFFRLRIGRWPAIAFVGWRRLAGVVLISCLVPIGLYAIYARSGLSGRHRAADNSVERLAIEYAAVACAVLALLRILSDRALRIRGGELDAAELKRRPAGKWKLAAGIVLAGGVGMFLVLAHDGGVSTRMQWLFPLLAAGLIGYMLMWLGGGQERSEKAASGRAFSPALTWAAITGAIVAGGYALFSRTFSRNFEGIIRDVSWIIFALAALLLIIRGIVQMRRGIAQWERHTFSYRLSVLPAIVFSTLVLALFAGLPLAWQERRAVAAMTELAQAYDPSREMERSSWSELKEWMRAKATEERP